jgi:prophage antirepressor-like protein
MINIQTYTNVLPGHGIRIDISNPNKPMFVARDVTLSLGYKVPQKAVADHCLHGEKMTVPKQNGQRGGAQFLTIIPEGDVYRLIVRSKLPAAQEFERKVFDEILPQIRQTGGYIPATQNDSDETIMARALMIADKTIKKLELDNAEMHEKLDYSTVDAYRALHKGEYWPHGRSISLGLRAAHICRSRDIEIRTEMRDVEYRRTNGLKGTTVKGINVYPTYVLDEAYAAMRGAA